jgi:hypothetical protein
MAMIQERLHIGRGGRNSSFGWFDFLRDTNFHDGSPLEAARVNLGFTRIERFLYLVGRRGVSLLSRNILAQALLTAPTPCIYFQTAPQGSLSSIVRLLCLPETAIGLWGRFQGSEGVELRLRKRHSPTAGSNWANRSI